MPRALEALYLQPLRREAEFGVPSCDLQLRSYSLRNLEFFCDFALRAAYFCGLPAFGPVPLPRMVERWTVPKSTFIFKKSQENFERITMRRLIQIRDGHPETVQLWLAFLQRHAYYGIGLKANVWEFSKLSMFGSRLPNWAWETIHSQHGVANLWVNRHRQRDGQQLQGDGEAFGGQMGAHELCGTEAEGFVREDHAAGESFGTGGCSRIYGEAAEGTYGRSVRGGHECHVCLWMFNVSFRFIPSTAVPPCNVIRRWGCRGAILCRVVYKH